MLNKKQNVINQDLIDAQKRIAELLQSSCIVIEQERESQEYWAHTLKADRKIIKYRSAKITPTKVGQFVTLWKRINAGPIMPFDLDDPIDLFVISVRNNLNFGLFMFPKDILWQKGYVSKNQKGGKRAMRVYPPWDNPDNNQARKSQKWQLLYFYPQNKID